MKYKVNTKFKYDITTVGYLKRAERQLSSTRPESVFYAAFELRCAIETRARGQLLRLNNIPLKVSRLWNAEKIMNEVFKRVGVQETQKVSLVLKPSGKLLDTFQYRTLTKSIIKEYAKLGDLLHLQRNEINFGIVENKRIWLKDILKEIKKVCKGCLLLPLEGEVECPKCKQHVQFFMAKDGVVSCKCGESVSIKDSTGSIDISDERASKLVRRFSRYLIKHKLNSRSVFS